MIIDNLVYFCAWDGDLTGTHTYAWKNRQPNSGIVIHQLHCGGAPLTKNFLDHMVLGPFKSTIRK